MENEWTEVKNYYQVNKEKLQKILWECYINLSKDEKNAKGNYTDIRTENRSDTARERKKNIWKCFTIKVKNRWII